MKSTSVSGLNPLTTPSSTDPRSGDLVAFDEYYKKALVKRASRSLSNYRSVPPPFGPRSMTFPGLHNRSKSSSPDERVARRGRTRDGGHAGVATPFGLCLPAGGRSRIGWHVISTATWEAAR